MTTDEPHGEERRTLVSMTGRFQAGDRVWPITGSHRGRRGTVIAVNNVGFTGWRYSVRFDGDEVERFSGYELAAIAPRSETVSLRKLPGRPTFIVGVYP